MALVRIPNDGTFYSVIGLFFCFLFAGSVSMVVSNIMALNESKTFDKSNLTTTVLGINVMLFAIISFVISLILIMFICMLVSYIKNMLFEEAVARIKRDIELNQDSEIIPLEE